MKPAVMDVTTVDIARAIMACAIGQHHQIRGLPFGLREARDEDAPRPMSMTKTRFANCRTGERPAPGFKELSRASIFTQPPPRYTEATLVKALEENGIGGLRLCATFLRFKTDICGIGRTPFRADGFRLHRQR
jgi:DNA topoisomerase-1